ncbi:EH domain-binding protein 1, partial [Galemys pyrenaicus]
MTKEIPEASCKDSTVRKTHFQSLSYYVKNKAEIKIHRSTQEEKMKGNEEKVVMTN